MDKQVPPVQNQPKPAGIVAKTHPKYIKNVHRGNHKSNIFSGEIPRTHLTKRASPSRAFPLPQDHFQRRGDGPELGLIQFLIWVKHWRFLIRNMNEINQPKMDICPLKECIKVDNCPFLKKQREGICDPPPPPPPRF